MTLAGFQLVIFCKKTEDNEWALLCTFHAFPIVFSIYTLVKLRPSPPLFSCWKNKEAQFQGPHPAFFHFNTP